MVGIVIVWLLLVPVLAAAQTTHTVTLSAAQEAQLAGLAAARAEAPAVTLQTVVSLGLQGLSGQHGAQRFQQLQEVWGQLTPQQQTQMAAQGRGQVPQPVVGPQPIPQEGTPGVGQPPEETPLFSLAGVFVGLGAALTLGFGLAGSTLKLMVLWAVGYLCWEFRPCRRLLFGVVRRLYPRSLEE